MHHVLSTLEYNIWLSLKRWGFFWGYFRPSISPGVLIVWKWWRYVKYLKIFEVSENFEKKGFSDPEHPKPTNPIFEKIKIFIFFSKNFENFICGFGYVLGPKSPFFFNFRKLQKILNTLHTFAIFIRQVLVKIFGLEFGQEKLKMGFWGVQKGENHIFFPLDVFENKISGLGVWGIILMR